MNILGKLEKLIMLAWFNNQDHEQQAAWNKARELMTRKGLGYSSLSARLANICAQLDTLFGTEPIVNTPSKTQEQQQRTQQDQRTPGFDWQDFSNRYARYTSYARQHRQHIVRQPHATRTVDDKTWYGRVCKQCGIMFSYDAYPGNPRQYCSDKCKAEYLRGISRERMRARRAR